MKLRTQCFYRWIFGYEHKIISKKDLYHTAKEFLKLSEIDRTDPDFEKHYQEVTESQLEEIRENNPDIPELQIQLIHSRAKMALALHMSRLKLTNAILNFKPKD